MEKVGLYWQRDVLFWNVFVWKIGFFIAVCA